MITGPLHTGPSSLSVVDEFDYNWYFAGWVIFRWYFMFYFRWRAPAISRHATVLRTYSYIPRYRHASPKNGRPTAISISLDVSRQLSHAPSSRLLRQSYFMPHQLIRLIFDIILGLPRSVFGLMAQRFLRMHCLADAALPPRSFVSLLFRFWWAFVMLFPHEHTSHMLDYLKRRCLSAQARASLDIYSRPVKSVPHSTDDFLSEKYDILL